MKDQHAGKRLRIPAAGAHLWRWFRSLDGERSGTGAGINRLQSTQIESWSRLRGIKFRPWHLEAIELLDMTRVQLFYETQDGPTANEPIVSERPMSMELFDALF